MTTAQPRVSMLMPNRNNDGVLDHVLERLAANTTYPNSELVVIDDGSTDSSLEILRRWRDSGRIDGFRLLERRHGGVIDALNAGLAEASGELVVQLDADASLEATGWLERMVACFESDARVGVVTGRVVFDWGEIQACGVSVIGREGFHGRGCEITEPAGRRTNHERVKRPLEGACPACEVPAEVDGGIGCCMMYRRQAALDIGGYDPGFAPVWFDDFDLTLSLRRAGYKVFFVPEVRVIHHVASRTRARTRKERGKALTQKLAAATLPPRLRHTIARKLGFDLMPEDVRQRLEHHYAYWREKWGFDMLNPDMDAVRERWGETELCWRLNDEMREAGERIVSGFASAAPARFGSVQGR